MKNILPTNENQILLYYFPNCIDIIEIDLLSTQRPSKTLLMACFLLQASRRMIHSFEYVFPSLPQTGLAIRLHGKSHLEFLEFLEFCNARKH